MNVYANITMHQYRAGGGVASLQYNYVPTQIQKRGNLGRITDSTDTKKSQIRPPITEENNKKYPLYRLYRR